MTSNYDTIRERIDLITLAAEAFNKKVFRIHTETKQEDERTILIWLEANIETAPRGSWVMVLIGVKARTLGPALRSYGAVELSGSEYPSSADERQLTAFEEWATSLGRP